jgi:hypothetical protein
LACCGIQQIGDLAGDFRRRCFGFEFQAQGGAQVSMARMTGAATSRGCAAAILLSSRFTASWFSASASAPAGVMTKFLRYSS